ncbi:MAG: ATP-binding cassette domain-containing protein, partial [Wujia sp.]
MNEVHTTMSILSVTNLSIGYENKVIVKDINFQVEEGQYVCIIGENGAGKSTLLKSLLKLNKPVSGEISYTKEGIG